MKKLNKYYFLGLLTMLMLSSCETIELDITDNPNALTPAQADVNFFLSNIQEDFARLMEALNQNGAALTRTSQLAGRNYQSTFLPATTQATWSLFYSTMLTDIRTMEPLAQEAGLTRHIAIAQFIEAYAVTAMVDTFGDIPFADAIQGAEGMLNPTLTPGADVYAAAFDLLDQAEINFTNDTSGDPNLDFFYGNDYDQWVRAVNTLRLKLNLQTRLVDPGAAARFNAIVAGGNFIEDNADDLDFPWPATSAVNPDTRHPRYVTSYTVSGGNQYQPNWLMNHMTVTADDPRRRYYFYRQTPAVPGQEIPPNEQLLNCSVEVPPAHYAGFTFCNLPDGYWGRDHGDQDGIPPDGFERTIFGVYPAGGRFDDNRFEGAGLVEGGQGAGISPLLTAGLTKFYQAEMAFVANDPDSALALIQEGVALHVAKVMSLGGLDPEADLSFAPTAGQVTGFINSIGANWTAADTMGRWNILTEEFLVTTFGSGHEAYNAYRRTGFPTTLQPNLEPNPGIFIRSFFYPSNAVNTNANITQKSSNSLPVYWDNNPNPPAAN